MTSLYGATKGAFPGRLMEYYANETEVPLKQRRAAMDSAWDVVKEQRACHEKHQASVGFNPNISDHEMLTLSVGGIEVNVPRALFRDAEIVEKTTLGNLMGGAWDELVPQDADGRIIIDESPQCGKVMIPTYLH